VNRFRPSLCCVKAIVIKKISMSNPAREIEMLGFKTLSELKEALREISDST